MVYSKSNNKEILKTIRDFIQTYHNDNVKVFYEKCVKNNHSAIANTIMRLAKENSYKDEFKLDDTFKVQRTNYADIEELTIFVKYIDVENNKLIKTEIRDTEEGKEYIIVYINRFYLNSIGRTEYSKYIRLDFMYILYLLEHNIENKHDNIYIKNLRNNIDISEVEFEFIKFIFKLLSPIEKIERKENVLSNIKDLSLTDIDKLNIGLRHEQRIINLIDYTKEYNYYDMLYFVLFNLCQGGLENTRMLLYLGYFLNKIGLYKIDITKEYIQAIRDINYNILYTSDEQLAQKVYDFIDEQFREYLYDLYILIQKEIDSKKDELSD